MKRFHQRSPYRVTLNHAFGEVIEGCASDRDEGTWITSSIVRAYHQLHELGHAHSIEVWQENTLVGGMYGVAQGALFCGESMFSRAENASKTALLVFCQDFAHSGGKLIDCQVLNNHTASLGAVDIPAAIIWTICRYYAATDCPSDFGCRGCYFLADNKMFSAHFASGWYNCAVE